MISLKKNFYFSELLFLEQSFYWKRRKQYFFKKYGILLSSILFERKALRNQLKTCSTKTPNKEGN
jgi:hypothetical protein